MLGLNIRIGLNLLWRISHHSSNTVVLPSENKVIFGKLFDLFVRKKLHCNYYMVARYGTLIKQRKRK